jgi:hypothetical protein
MVAEAVDLAEIVQQPLLLSVVLVVMADYLLEVVGAAEALEAALAVQVAKVVMVWFVFILGNQL